MMKTGLLENEPKGTHTGTLLFALSERERRIFFPDFDFSVNCLGGLEAAMIDPSTLDAAGWEDALTEFNPRVLVTAWSGKTVPEQWYDSRGCALEYVCHVTGSVRKVVPRTLLERELCVTNWGATITHTIAEHALLMVLGLLRNVPLWESALDREEHALPLSRNLKTRSLRGKRVGIHGFGAIAREIARLLKPFQVELCAYSQGVPDSHFVAHEVIQLKRLESLFEQCDVVIECEGLTPENRGVVDEAMLRRLPRDAVFVNVARADLTDEEALYRLAQEGDIRLGLDVFQEEPLRRDSPMRSLSGAWISPHIAGPTWDTYPVCGEHALQNIRKFSKGAALSGVVDLAIYDRST
tara:strand:- start:2936 stop:3994 length:1059 start_codon:yes stop_codon:yes gene_type:complete